MATIPASCSSTAAEWQKKLASEFRRLRIFGDVSEDELACVARECEERHTAANAVIAEESQPFEDLMLLLEGKVMISRRAQRGGEAFTKKIAAPGFFGEVPLLTDDSSHITVVALTPLYGARISREGFWRVMQACPHVRAAILAASKVRMQSLQAERAQSEKMAMLGTMTAGLMHELNNPGAAAHRAAQQLRSNLQRMHTLARAFSERGHGPEQRVCLLHLQEQALAVKADACMGSLEQSDAEETLGTWMEGHNLQNAWKLAPVLVASGIGIADLECLAAVFPAAELSEPIEWVEATASSMQMVGLVEDSVARVSALAAAVKTYAHEGQGGVQDVDVNESVHATLVMLKHKMREKNLSVKKEFGGGIPRLHCVCSGLNQVWTNLLDNAIDAVQPGGHLGIRTSFVDGEIQVAIRDDGAGIAPEDQERIFENFYTTKPAGVGTGLGLGIVQRVLESYNGRLTLESKPGSTEFVAHVPLTQA